MAEGSHPRQIEAARERDERIAAYTGKPRMGFLEFTLWLDFYRFRVDADLDFVFVLWIRWGSDLPKSALLTDHPELEYALLGREDKRPDLHRYWLN
jgi:hypothetical protein